MSCTTKLGLIYKRVIVVHDLQPISKEPLNELVVYETFTPEIAGNCHWYIYVTFKT